MSDNLPRILLLCATQKGFEVLKAIIEKYQESLVGVSTFREVNMQESFYESIIKQCDSAGIPKIEWTVFKANPEEIIKRYKINCIVAISWKYYIPVNLNKFLKNKIIIIHDSILPKYRGFAPLPTAVIKGEKEVGISAIYATDKIDHGDIIQQKRMIISPDKYIKDVIIGISNLYKEAVIELIENLKADKKLSPLPQDHSQATYSIWRSPDDCQIDWNNSSTDIYNLIRAVSYPYMGAFTYLLNEKVYIWKSEIITPDAKFGIRNPGKIWELDDLGQPVVVCGNGLLKIIEATSNGRSLMPIKKLRQRFYFKNAV